MAVKFLLFAILLAISSKGEALTCLHCNGVYQPRHCRAVVDCFKGEICEVEKVLNNYGEYVYNLGCVSAVECSNNHAVNTSNTEACSHCCESDLCNSEGCGETGYPISRGPICYSCQVQREGRPCRNIDFCKIGEMCQFQETEEFGDLVVKVQCTNAHTCHKPDSGHSILVGRNTDGIHARTAEQHICDACCMDDLCNKDCHTAHKAQISNDTLLPTTDGKTSLTSITTTTTTSAPTTHSFQTTSDIIPTTVIGGNRILAIFGQDMIKYIRVNETRVVRGRDWGWGDQDGHGPGTIVGWAGNSQVYVQWDKGGRSNYRMGLLGLYDLYIVSL